MREVRTRDNFRKGVDNIHTYIAYKFGISHAYEFEIELARYVTLLSNFPNMGRITKNKKLFSVRYKQNRIYYIFDKRKIVLINIIESIRLKDSA